MNYFSIKISDPDSLKTVKEIKANSQDFSVEKLSQLDDRVNVGDIVFMHLSGEESKVKNKWVRGLVGIAKVLEGPLDKGTDPDHKKNYRLRLRMVLLFPNVIEREEFKYYFNAYDAAGIGPTTKGEQNQAIKEISEAQVCAIIRVVLEKYQGLVPKIKACFSPAVCEKVYGEMTRFYEREVTYDEALPDSRIYYQKYANERVRRDYEEYLSASLKQRKKLFNEWLSKQYIPVGRNSEGNLYSEKVREAYVNALEKKARELNGLFCRNDNLYEYTDLVDFLKVRERIIECSNFAEVNARVINNGFSPALDKYSEFLLSLYFGNPEEIKKRKTCRDIVLHERERATHSLNVILYGPPGTGKTYSTVNYALAIVHNEPVDFGNNDLETRAKAVEEFNALMDDGQIVFTTFHQNYGYEEFIQGLRPDLESETMKLHLQDGVFKRISDRALNNPDKDFVIILDEVNRANISKVFGELITLIEEDKRWGESNQMWLTLQSGEFFSVPNNLYIIGTMNSADKSISLIDAALRRRFEFKEFEPQAELISDENLQNIFVRLNKHLVEELNSSDLLVGHSYFIGKTITDLPKILNNKVIPLLYEYFYDQREKVETAISDALTGYNVVYKDGNTGRLRVDTINR